MRRGKALENRSRGTQFEGHDHGSHDQTYTLSPTDNRTTISGTHFDMMLEVYKIICT